MKTGKVIRKAGNDFNGGEQVKSKLVSKKEKKTKNSIFDEIEEDEATGYIDLKSSKDKIFDYYDDEIEEDEYDDDFDEDEYDDEDEGFDEDDDFEDDEE